MEFKTSISKVTKDDVIIRNKKLSSLIEENLFSDSIFFLLLGRKPSLQESKIFSAILISIIDHGMGTTSSMTSRFVMSGGNALNTAVGAGVLALGDYHGGAIENAMNQLIFVKKKDIKEYLMEMLKNKKIIFGYGHKIYKDSDARVIKILSLCDGLNYKSEYIENAKKIEKILSELKEKKICLNIDGLIAAILLEMGFKPEYGKGIFIIGRIPGLIAQAIEEKEREKPVRRIDEDKIVYLGNE